MEKEKVLTTLDEIKTISDPFRLKILFLFDEEKKPLTVKQMATKLEEVPAKVHYHVKELERIGVMEIVETREKSGIVEKYYGLTAETFKVERSLTNPADDDEHFKVGANLFQAMQQDFERSNRHNTTKEKGMLNYGLYHMTAEEKEQLRVLISDFLENKTQRESTNPYMFGYALFRKFDGKEKEQDGD